MAKKPPKPPKAPLAVRVKTDPKLLARVLANPGLRAQLPEKYLTPEQRQQRYLAQPVTPGSSTTNAAAQLLARRMTDTQFGPNAEAMQAQRNKDVAGWYAAYQRDLQQHTQNIGQYGRTSVDQIGGLAQAAGNAAPGATGEAADAARVRQAMLAASGSAQSARAASDTGYADTLANVVAPGQRLQAQAQGQSNLRDLQDRIANAKADALDKIKAAEADAIAKADDTRWERAVAEAGLNLNITKAGTAAADADADRALEREKARAAAATTAGEVNAYGYTKAAWNAMSTAKRRQIMADDWARKHPPKDPKKEDPFLGKQGQNDAKSSIDSTVTMIKSLRDKGYDQHQIRQLLLLGRGAKTVERDGQKVTQSGIKPTKKIWVNAAMDVAYLGYLGAANVKALTRYGVKVPKLGYPTTKPAAAASPLGPIAGTATGTVGIG
jgi:hypothetical protein